MGLAEWSVTGTVGGEKEREKKLICIPGADVKITAQARGTYIRTYLYMYIFLYIRIEIPRRDTFVANERLLRGENVPIHAQRLHGFRANAVWIAATTTPRSRTIVRYGRSVRCLSIENARVKGVWEMKVRGGDGQISDSFCAGHFKSYHRSGAPNDVTPWTAEFLPMPQYISR